MKCPNCGQESPGKYCSNCGSALSGATCAACGASLSTGARFCHVCGTPLRSPRAATGPTSTVPWIVAAVAVALLVVVLVARSGGPALSPPAPSPTSAGAEPGAASTDLSQMTPREQADRLFDRVMRARESGNSQEVSFFGPMALQAYGMVGPPDADARFHIGLIDAALGNDAGTTAQADSLERQSPRHLFVPLLRWEVANQHTDAAAMRQAYRQFLDNYDREIATGNLEYQAHQNRLEAFREEARGALGNAAP